MTGQPATNEESSMAFKVNDTVTLRQQWGGGEDLPGTVIEAKKDLATLVIRLDDGRELVVLESFLAARPLPVVVTEPSPYSRRPIMSNAELRGHEISAEPRNYLLSCDGYGDMELAEKRGWTTISGWGRDGWDLGRHPYVSFQVRTVSVGPRTPQDRRYQVQQIVEGDHTVYQFGTEADRDAAIDYLFVWYALDERWSPWKWGDREALDAGQLAIEDKYRGPFSWERPGSAEAGRAAEKDDDED